MTATPNPSPADQPASFEVALARIETIVHELEEGQTGLAESLARYEEGVKLLRQCYGLLEKAEHKIELLVRIDAAGNPVTEPFDDTASTDREPQGTPKNRRRSATTGKAVARQSVEVPPDEHGSANSGVDSAGGLF